MARAFEGAEPFGQLAPGVMFAWCVLRCVCRGPFFPPFLFFWCFLIPVACSTVERRRPRRLAVLASGVGYTTLEPGAATCFRASRLKWVWRTAAHDFLIGRAQAWCSGCGQAIDGWR